jgi:DNA-binding MarR family transcriptional regulator
MDLKRAPSIPEQAFTTLGFAVPALARLIDKRCGITLGAWLVLSEIKRRGKVSADGPMMLRNELTRLFDERGFSRPNVTKILNVLFEKQLVARPRLTAPARQELFGSDGSRLAVSITRKGVDKIEEFTRVLQGEFDGWYSRQRLVVRHALNALLPIAVNLAAVLMDPQKELQ